VFRCTDSWGNTALFSISVGNRGRRQCQCPGACAHDYPKSKHREQQKHMLISEGFKKELSSLSTSDRMATGTETPLRQDQTRRQGASLRGRSGCVIKRSKQPSMELGKYSRHCLEASCFSTPPERCALPVRTLSSVSAKGIYRMPECRDQGFNGFRWSQITHLELFRQTEDAERRQVTRKAPRPSSGRKNTKSMRTVSVGQVKCNGVAINGPELRSISGGGQATASS